MRGGLGRIYRGETDIDFIGRRRLWFLISAVIIILCFVTFGVRGLNYGIEFEGGVQILADIPQDGPLGDATEVDVISEVRDAVEDAEPTASDAQIQVVTDDEGRAISVQTKEAANPEAQQRVITAVSDATGATPAETDSQRIGSKWGEEVTDKAVRALVVFLVVVFLFISWRFEWKMAVASIIALVHDLIITAGVYSLIGFEVTPSTVIAILTILGYSLYDTVVVFDKVEENATALAATGRMTYQDSANLSLNQVFMRSLNTSLSTLLPVAALLIIGAGLLGAATLKDLALALLVGLLIGSYSSVFLATPVLSLWKEHELKFKNVRERLERTKARAGLPSGAAEEAQEEREEKVHAAVTTGPRAPRSPARPRAGSKKSKRRKRR